MALKLCYRCGRHYSAATFKRHDRYCLERMRRRAAHLPVNDTSELRWARLGRPREARLADKDY